MRKMEINNLLFYLNKFLTVLERRGVCGRGRRASTGAPHGVNRSAALGRIYGARFALGFESRRPAVIPSSILAGHTLV